MEKKRFNYSDAERSLLTELVRNKPVIENKTKTAEIEEKKRKAWKDLTQTYNSKEFVTTRTEAQLKVRDTLLGLYRSTSYKGACKPS